MHLLRSLDQQKLVFVIRLCAYWEMRGQNHATEKKVVSNSNPHIFSPLTSVQAFLVP